MNPYANRCADVSTFTPRGYNGFYRALWQPIAPSPEWIEMTRDNAKRYLDLFCPEPPPPAPPSPEKS